METPHLAHRIKELFTYLEYLKEAADKDVVMVNEILIKRDKSQDEDEKLELLKKAKKVQFFNNMKLMEVEKTIPVLIELYKIAQLMDIGLDLSDQQNKIIETNIKRIVPMYIIDKSELVFFNKEIEEAVDAELSNPAKTDGQAIKNVLGALVKDE